MRDLPSGLAAKLSKPVQVRATDADPRLEAWLSRSTTQLVSGTSAFLEKLTVSASASVSAADIAIKRPQIGGIDRSIYIAYIDNGKAKVKASPSTIIMDDHVFVDSGFEEDADDVAICFDGTMPLTRDGSEFVTEREPWVFWCKDGALYGTILHANMQPVTLATENCTKVTAVRAPWALGAANDYGLCVFFLLSGAIYYRQYIGGEWMDAEVVSFGPTTTWADIAATRTWDYRLCLQCKDTSGNIYDFFTRYFGLGNQIAEHIDLERIDANGHLISVAPHDGNETEHIELSSVAANSALLYAYSASPVSAANISDGGDWGKKVVVTMNHPVSGGATSDFYLLDSNGIRYPCTDVSASGASITLTFINFNAAASAASATVVYTQGTLMSPVVLTDSFTVNFTPTGLVPIVGTLPAPVSAVSSNANGTEIVVTFSEAITLSSAAGLSVVISEYDYVPGGTLSSASRSILSADISATDATKMTVTLAAGNTTSFQSAVGNVHFVYDGSGVLSGASGPVQPFDFSFSPGALVYKGGQNDAEHIELSSVSATGTLTAVTYRDTQDGEHLELSNITAVGVLTHVDDT